MPVPFATQTPLAGKVIVQIGGSGLLGPVLAEALARAGGRVVITSRDRSRVADLAKGLDVYAEQCSLDSEDEILRLRDRVLDVHQRVDGLVYNAVSYTMHAGWTADIGKWNESMKVNASGLFATLRAFGDVMAAQRSGSIVTISSIHGLGAQNPWLYEGTAMNSAPDYFFHKAGMVNLTRFAASHYGARGVRVNSVAPGGIFDVKNPDPESFVRRYAKMTALGRMAQPQEVGGAVIFLLSDAASYVTGAVLAVDGGYTAR